MSGDSKLNEAIDVLSPHCEFGFLMGSYGTDRFHKESDIDLAVFFKKATLSEEKRNCWLELEKIFSREVDLVELNAIDPIFGHQVLETGRLLFSGNPGLLLQWKATQTSLYIDFKMDRAIVEKNMLNRKKYV